MSIHGHSPGTMALLPILLTILFTLSTPFIHAIPFKIPIDIDLSGPLPTRVGTILSSLYPGGIHYAINEGSRSSYILGRVRDGDEVLIEGDPRAISRYILVITRDFSSAKYIRIITRWRRENGSYTTRVEEFMRGHMDGHYRPIIRAPIEVDILAQDIAPYINVRALEERPNGQSRPNGDSSLLPTHYTISPFLWLTHMIGIVRYGHVILASQVDGLLTREVIWTGGPDVPIIIITSKYHNGTEVTIKYALLGGRFHATDYRSKLIELRE